MSRMGSGSSVSPRRVLMTVAASDELWEHSLELCRGLSDACVEVVLAVLGRRPDQRQVTAALCIEGVELTLAPFRRDGLEGQPGQPHDWLLELEQARKCDVVHLNGYEQGELPFRSPKVLMAASCGLSWWQAVKGIEAPPAWDSYRRKVTGALAAADVVVAPSTWLLEALDDHYGPLPASTVIPAGRSPASFTPGEKEPFVLGVGALGDEAKNTALLARVAPRLPWPVKIVGASAPARDKPDDGGPDPAGAILLGRVDRAKLTGLYAQAAIFASTSRFETFALEVHEAALSECALVLSDIPSLRELWGGAAVFVPPDDEEALQTALCTLMNQPELTALLALRAHQRAVSNSSTRMVKRYLAVYRKLLALRPATPLERELRSSCVS